MDAADNLDEYADPALYDLENHKFEPEGPFYLALAQRLGGNVLELGCGTGRLTIPLAQQGLTMTGLDVAPQMLRLAREKASALPIHWVEADARRFQLGRRFGFIFEAGATFQHMLTRADQVAYLTRVREHLAPGGHMVVAAQMLAEGLMTDEPDEAEWFSYTGPEGQPVRVSGNQLYDAATQIKTETAYRRWHTAEGEEVVRVAPLKLRLTFPAEMEALLRENGFVVRERYGDYDFSPLADSSPNQLYVGQGR
jgi:SAM-dependent methyltransferase